VCAGSEFDPNVYNISHLINYVGFMPYAETGELYRSIDIGVSLMASSHPSYPPIEMMACATVVVTNQNPATSEFFSEKNAVVVPPITDEIVETIAELIQKPEVRKKLSSSASAFARESIQDWKSVSQEFHSLIKG
jgi:glycosyltransferase involved in cell wall biosynthesis